jgi:hypothetical protein
MNLHIAIGWGRRPHLTPPRRRRASAPPLGWLARFGRFHIYVVREPGRGRRGLRYLTALENTDGR